MQYVNSHDSFLSIYIFFDCETSQASYYAVVCEHQW